MDELIVLLVRGLMKLLGGDAQRPVRSINAPWESSRPAASPQKTIVPPEMFSARPMKRRTRGRRPSPVVPVSVPPAVPAAAPPLAAVAPVKSKTRELQSVNAAALHRWLTPQTLRRQFILTEVLQPPLTLRDSDHPLQG